MFIELTQDLGVQTPPRKVMWNMDTVEKFYANERGGCTLDMKDGRKLCVTDKYESFIERIVLAQISAK